MPRTPVTHYYWSDGPYDLPMYCRPTLEPKLMTDQLEAVTCKACLKKLAKAEKES